MNTTEPNRYDEQAAREAIRRDTLTRSIRLLKRLNAAVSAGDPVPPIAEILTVTGLDHPGTDAPDVALAALLATAEAERASLRRQIKLTRELRDAVAVPAPRGPPPTPPTARAPQGPTIAPAPVIDEVARVGKVEARDLDALPYGAILMDDTGRIVAYNDAESRMARLPVEAVLGRNFFTEVAPCTRVKEFEGRFRALAADAGPGIAAFDFTFPFPFGAQRISVLLTRHTQPGHVIMALVRR